MMKSFGFIFLALTSTISLLQCPHSKVEESFNLQATHDLYYHGLGPALQSTRQRYFHDHADHSNDHTVSASTAPVGVYDHLQYPGVVPRTFIGPLIISSVVKCLSFAMRPFFSLEENPLILQSMARGVLLLFNLHAHYRLANAANQKFNPSSSKNCSLAGYFLAITACQFHIPFYASRMLPNIYALGLVTHSYADWLQANISRSIVLMVFAATVFRCDVIILLFTFGTTLLLRRDVSIIQAIKIGMTTVIVSLVVTVPLDSIMWQRAVWPEGEVLFFNTVENKSSDYGVSPWYWYAVKALPKGLLFTIFLIPFAFIRIPHRLAGFKVHWCDLKGFPYILPIIAFVALYSILPHKEIRFIFIAFPMFNVMAAKALSDIQQVAELSLKSNGSIKKEAPSLFSSRMMIHVLSLCGIASLALSFLVSMAFMQVSKKNYPGGNALEMLSEILEGTQESDEAVKIFVDVAAAMTGVSLFGQQALTQCCKSRECSIVKGGYEDENEYDSFIQNGAFEYILSENRIEKGYDVIGIAEGHPKINIKKLRIGTNDAIFIHERSKY